jgi:WhiB family redox-sensing transcriptional regulator
MSELCACGCRGTLAETRSPYLAGHQNRFMDIPGPGKWAEQGACVGHPDPDLWFPDSADKKGPPTYPKDRKQAALAICQGCEVKSQCAEYAEETPGIYGLWGGLFWPYRRDRMSGRNRD